MIIDLIQIESELKKRLNYPYKWGRKQNDYFDKLTNFVYKISSFEEVLYVDIALHDYSQQLMAIIDSSPSPATQQKTKIANTLPYSE